MGNFIVAAEALTLLKPIVLLTAIGLPLGSILIQLLVGLLTPGRKGKIRAEKWVFHRNVSAAQARETYTRRLGFEGFRFEPAAEEGVLRAERSKSSGLLSMFEVKTFAKMPLKAEIHFLSRPEGVEVRLALWTGTSIYVDTGESVYIDSMVNRLLDADLEREPPPTVQNLSSNAQSSLYIGILLLLAPFLYFHPWFNTQRALDLAVGLFLAFVTNMVLAAFGVRDVWMKPREMRGKGQVILGILFSIAALILGLFILGLTHFGALSKGRF